MLLYNTAAKALANFINAHKRIKGIQIGNHVIKIINFAANTTILLTGDITCHNRIHVFLKLYENANINYLKPLWADAYENRIDQTTQFE